MTPKEQCSEQLKQVITALQACGAKVYFVGGCVRDSLLGQTVKDFDFEVFHLPEKKLEACLKTFGDCDYLGKSFGVYKLRQLPEADFALPRREEKIAEGHQGFMITVDPDCDLRQAASRRDLCVNAIYYDAMKEVYCDPYQGMQDLQNGILRVVDERRFGEDPLRILRLARFISVLGFRADTASQALCRKLVAAKALETLSPERVAQEYDRLLMGKAPEKGLRFLGEIGALPEVFAQLAHTHQRPDYHPEGSAWEHTLLVVKEAAQVKMKTDDPLSFMYSAWLHDIGKTVTTDAFGHAYHHDEVGAQMVKDVLKIFPLRKHLTQYCQTMVRYHMKLMKYARQGAKDQTYLKLLWQIDGKVSLKDLYYLTCCDAKGKGIDSQKDLDQLNAFMCDHVKRLSDRPPEPIVSGQVLLANGFKAGPQMKKLLERAYLLQLSGQDRSQILKQLRKEQENGTRKPCD